VISYLIFFAEALIALPMTAVSLAHPDGQGPLSQVAGKAVMLVLRIMAQPIVMLIAFAFAMAATEAVGSFVLAVTLPSSEVAITSGVWGWVGRLSILTAAILMTVFTIWEIVMGFTNQIFKWVGDVSNDLGENKANTAFVGVMSGSKGAASNVAQAGMMKASIDDDPKPGGDPKKPDPTQAMQATDRSGAN